MTRWNTKGMVSSMRTDWNTPKDLYEKLDEEFNFDFDPCPSNWDGTWDGLTIEWKQRNYVNPPYGRQLSKWLAKGWLEAQKGKLVVFLLPARTDTKWWHEYVMRADEVRFIKGRLQFDDNPDHRCPFPSVIVVFCGGKKIA